MQINFDLKKIISFLAIATFGLFSWLVTTTYNQALTLKEMETELKFISKNVGKISGKVVYLKGQINE